MSIKYTKNDGRTKEFSRNILLESLLKDVNNELWNSEKLLLSNYSGEMRKPLILLMGPMRSGTTLFIQWLANTGLVSYPTNLLSRFYQSPIIGAKIQLLLTDPRFNFRNELGEFIQKSEYKSENGKTRGVLAPNEFWYFWRRFLEDPSRDVWTDEELRQSMDVGTMKSELVGIMDVFQKPFATKGMLFNYNIPFLDSILDKVIFVQMKRDMATNISSVLDARKRQLGNDSDWYSFKIPEYPQLKFLEPTLQAAGQIHYINMAVTAGLKTVSDKRKMVVQYEDFCTDPHAMFKILLNKLDKDSTETRMSYSGPDQFRQSRIRETIDQDSIQKALKYLENNHEKVYPNTIAV